MKRLRVLRAHAAALRDGIDLRPCPHVPRWLAWTGPCRTCARRRWSS